MFVVSLLTGKASVKFQGM